MKRRAAAGVDAAGETDEATAGPTASTRVAADRPLAVPAATEPDDSELDEPLPDAERLVDEAVAQCGEDLDSARLVRRYWRFAPDEELVGLSDAELVRAAREHRELARQRLPGELKLQVDESADVEPDDAIAGDIIESWMLLHVDRVRDPGQRDELLRDLKRVLTDVREAVEDWPKMRGQALALADELEHARLPVPERDITDSVELLRWLVDD